MVRAEGLSGSPPQARQYGVTKPISLAGPTEADIQRSAELEKVALLLMLLSCFHSSDFRFFDGL